MNEGNIFLSYRRDDSAGYARAVFDQLVMRFSDKRVFMDVETIEPGLPFDQVIHQAVGNCRVLLVMIGKRWMEPRDGGLPRIHDPDDFVRIEVSAALSRDIRVIPVLLDGASMPAESQLPEVLRPLARRNAIELSNSRFQSDIAKLVEAVAGALGETAIPDARRPANRRSVIYAAVSATTLAILAPTVWWFGLRREDSHLGTVQAQSGWRFCRKCQTLFFDGYATKGTCAAGGAHSAEGHTFVLRYDTSAPGQLDWRFCNKCSSLFFDGSTVKGQCPAGGAHSAQGFNFVLDHDRSVVGQADWRYCRKCQSMFFDGYPDKGVCAAGGTHVAAGYNFVLPFT